MTTGKPEAAIAVVVAPDDGREDARSMLSCLYCRTLHVATLVIQSSSCTI